MGIYKRLFKYTPEKLYCLILSCLFSVISTVCSIAPYWFLWKFLKSVLVDKDYSGGKFYAIVIVSLLIVYTVFYFFSLWFSHLLGFRLEANLRKVGVKHLMKASFSFFDLNPSGKIRKIIDNNAQETHMAVAHLIPDNIAALLTPILMMVVVFLVDFQLGILLLIVTIIGGILMKLMMGDKAFMERYSQSLERLNAESVEYVRGMQIIKIFRNTIESFKNFHSAIVDYSKLAYSYSKSCRPFWVFFQVLFNLFLVFTIPVGIFYMNRGASPDLILAKIVFYVCFAGLLFNCFLRVMYVGMFNFKAKQVLDTLETLFDEMEKKAVPYGNENHFDHFDIEFKDVSFGYNEELVIKDLSFQLKEKKVYAFVGPSGGGKSTIAKLISGFYKINGGEILIGGKSLSAYTQEALMKNIAFVFQNTKLFTKMSIFENVKLGNPNATDKEVLEALHLACCDDILAKFKDREHTIIGSKGVHLSGGEVQRVAIARAILKNANIVILDEASAAADPENEYEIQRAFSNLMKNKTVIMIAHRISSIKNVDEILVIDNGLITERGSDQELQKKNGVYSKLQNLFEKANDWRVYDN